MESCEVLFYGEKGDFLAKSTSKPPCFEAEKYITGCKKYFTGRWIYLTAPFLKQRLAHIPKDAHKKHPTGKSQWGVYMLSVKTCSL